MFLPSCFCGVPDILQPRLRGEICHNVRIKEFPQGFLEILTASRAVFREPGYECSEKQKRSSPSVVSDEVRKQQNVARAVRRAKLTLRDLALCNDMRYFVTLTLDKSKVDRYDMAAVMRRVNAWCSNQVQRKGLAYILVPELHKDGAIHFHGFVNNAVEVVDSGTLSVPWSKRPRKPRNAAERADWISRGGHIVYNMPAWRIGYTTAIELYGAPEQAVGYCCKYIGKQYENGIPCKIGGRWFLHGGCKNRPEVRYADVDFDAVALSDRAFVFEVPAANAVFVRELINL